MQTSPNKVVFLDRDGVINRCFVREGVTYPPADLRELEILPGVPEALERLDQAGFVLVGVTNQPDVARGRQSRERVEEINDLLQRRLPLREIMTCFHDTPDRCECRKPKPGMLTQAATKWNLNLSSGFMVGDRWSDVIAGQAAGCRSILIDTPLSGKERCEPELCVEGLPSAVEWILSQS